MENHPWGRDTKKNIKKNQKVTSSFLDYRFWSILEQKYTKKRIRKTIEKRCPEKYWKWRQNDPKTSKKQQQIHPKSTKKSIQKAMLKKYQKMMKKGRNPHGKIELTRGTVVKNQRFRCSGERSKNGRKNIPKSSKIHPKIHEKINIKRCPKKYRKKIANMPENEPKLDPRGSPKSSQSR